MAASLRTVLDAVASLNFCGLRLALRNPNLAREYISKCLRLFDELMRFGLPPNNPIAFLDKEGWSKVDRSSTLELPTHLSDGGGTQIDELVYLAAITRRLQPSRIFEIGTYSGRTTAVFVMNAAADAEVITLDLPPDDPSPTDGYIATDLELIESRALASFARALGLGDRFRQILCDSLSFDPEPYRGTVELAFIDGAHSPAYVKSDTEKVAVMVADRSIVLWHDYGGKGSFRALSEYLEDLGRKARIYRVPGTTLAWASGAELRRALKIDSPATAGAGRAKEFSC
jgi:predicted O-methyltransferase YrrM